MTVTSGLYVQKDSFTKVTVSNGTIITNMQYDADANRQQWSRDSVRTPLFNTKKRPPILPMNPFQYNRTEIEYPQGWTRDATRDGKTVTTVTGFGSFHAMPTIGVSPFLIPQSEIDAMDKKVRLDLLLKIKEQKVNLMQAFAERDQTARLIGDRAMSIAQALWRLRHGDFKGAASAVGLNSHRYNRFERDLRRNQTKALARAWLELQYGWKPLLSDVYGAAEALAKAAVNGPPVDRVTKSSRTSRTITRRVDESWQQQVHYDHYEVELIMRYVCMFTANSPPIKTLSELGITNPALVAWELLPWSFVIDWFIPIGSFISSLDATFGLQFKTGSKTVLKKEKLTRSTSHGPSNGAGGTLAGSSFSTQRKVNCTRSVLFGFPESPFPDFKSPLGYIHMANAIALLRSGSRGPGF